MWVYISVNDSTHTYQRKKKPQHFSYGFKLSRTAALTYNKTKFHWESDMFLVSNDYPSVSYTPLGDLLESNAGSLTDGLVTLMFAADSTHTDSTVTSDLFVFVEKKCKDRLNYRNVA